MGSDNVVFTLPTDRINGQLEVYQDGKRIFNETVLCEPGAYSLPVYGSGETHITAYLDGELIYDKWITIDPYYG